MGGGIYFWEYAPKQALDFAKIRQRQYQKKKRKTADDERRATEPLAVMACMIRLGFCLDLTEPDNVEFPAKTFESYKEAMNLAGDPLPTNERKYRKLDCAVFKHAYKVVEDSGRNPRIDTARGIYVPRGGTKRIWRGSWISREPHIQLCVRNPASLLGAWLHHPSNLGVNDVRQGLQDLAVVVERANPQGEAELQKNVDAAED